ncbi:gp110 [Erwinia phage vB_EamP-S6]|uniref:Gp110 n=1 Tax=Erwinia phage vB_EamP-S6 TaxID=1051675 RepID=G0YQK2_9CAUD|nr:gp110 [Erwinia phage vB_EamP-S6]AEJ81629.1 gp110 [Erwinia phage vB_EamP-S6]
MTGSIYPAHYGVCSMALSTILLNILRTGDAFGLLPGTMATQMGPRQLCRKFIRHTLQGLPHDD